MADDSGSAERSNDLSRVLRDWPYQSGQINVRLIEGDDGEPKIQMRLDLGVLQMEASGRPDGGRPEGYESLLDFYESMHDELYAALDAEGLSDDDDDEDEEDGAGPEFVLSGEDCRKLREEAVQYYHRYISLLVLGDFLGVVRDTSRNLRVIDICEQFADEEEDAEVLLQFRPYILMMRTRALASLLINDDEPKAALFVIEDGLEQIRGVYEDAGRIEDFAESHEAQLLRSMRDELRKKLPASQKTELKRRLEEAIRAENYELAAILRDELRMLKD
jgi:hypothetical protein